jgi:hypothetical protein
MYTSYTSIALTTDNAAYNYNLVAKKHLVYYIIINCNERVELRRWPAGMEVKQFLSDSGTSVASCLDFPRDASACYVGYSKDIVSLGYSIFAPLIDFMAALSENPACMPLAHWCEVWMIL